MPRLKFDLTPISREDGWQDREEHEAWVRKIFAMHHPGVEPTPCDCGYFGDGWLTSCSPANREICRRDAPKRLEEHYRGKHLDALREKRKFPGVPYPGLGNGFCCWCSGELTLLKSGKRPQRWRHDGRAGEPNCKLAEALHTDLHAQRRHLFHRDGSGCFDCGQLVATWGGSDRVTDPVQLRAKDAGDDRFWHGIYPPKKWAGPFCSASIIYTGQVDHFIALGAAFPCFPENDRRRWFFGPGNLQLLCSDCHKAKTKNDTAFIRTIGKNGPEWGKAEIIHLLAQSGRLKPEKPL